MSITVFKGYFNNKYKVKLYSKVNECVDEEFLGKNRDGNVLYRNEN